MARPRLVLVGCGHMGFSILKGWQTLLEFPFDIEVVTPHQESLKEYKNSKKITWFSTPDLLKASPNIIIFAVKPYQLQEILDFYTGIISEDTIIVSIAAGKPICFYQGYFKNAPLVRAMPNIAATIGKGITLLYAEKTLTLSQKTIIDGIMGPLGKNYWIDDEESFEKAAALTSCGPAYIFYVVEALSMAGQALGLSETLVSQMSKDLIIGSVEYLKASNQSPALLREQVTSSKGMTAAALEILMSSKGLKKLFTEAIKAAFERSKEISKEQ